MGVEAATGGAAFRAVRFSYVKGFRSFRIGLEERNVLVGPNNAGKSTIVGAFRVLAGGLRKARTASPERFGPELSSRSGYRIPEEAIPISMENIHTDYATVDSTVRFDLTNGNALELLFPRNGGCYLLTASDSRPVWRPSEFRDAYPVELGVVPVLGPVEHDEDLVLEETVRRGLATHRASRHFRSYWYYSTHRYDWSEPGSDEFTEFASLVEETWPGMSIDMPYLPSSTARTLAMFCRENRTPREIYWSGSGFQVWCQLLTHLLRSKGASLVVIDEPEVYLHPNIQRQLLALLRRFGSTILLATHSSDIVNEAEPNEILIVDKTKRNAQRVVDRVGVQRALDHIGSSRAIALTQLARTRRVLLVEGDDFGLLKRFATALGLTDVATGAAATAVPLGGFPSPERVRSVMDGIRESLGDVASVLILDRDNRPDEEVEELTTALRSQVDSVTILRKKELENYLLNSDVLSRVLTELSGKVKKRAAVPNPELMVSTTHACLAQEHDETLAQFIGRRLDYWRRKGLNTTTVTKQAVSEFEKVWATSEGRIEVVSGKRALAALNGEFQRRGLPGLTPGRIADGFRREEVPAEISRMLRGIPRMPPHATGERAVGPLDG